MGALSFWYFWTIQARKKLINLIFKKGKILGEAQCCSISADWIFRVVNFGFHYLRHFSINFENSWAHLAANYLNFPKNTQLLTFGWFWRIQGWLRLAHFLMIEFCVLPTMNIFLKMLSWKMLDFRVGSD